jgi:hypothetical protein
MTSHSSRLGLAHFQQNRPVAACRERPLTGREPDVRASLRRNAYKGAPQEEAGREARLVLVRLTIRVLLQGQFLSGPRTENSTDLGAIDRALV